MSKSLKSLNIIAMQCCVPNVYGRVERYLNTQQCGDAFYYSKNSKRTKPQNKSFKRKGK